MVVLGVVVLREVIRWQELAGMGLIFLGLVSIDGRVPAYLAILHEMRPKKPMHRRLFTTMITLCPFCGKSLKTTSTAM